MLWGPAGREREQTAMATSLRQAAGNVAEMSPGSAPLAAFLPSGAALCPDGRREPFLPP